MGYSWLLKLAFNCIDQFAWPLLALGYPLRASVRAVETDSYQETRDLISYWILLSLIYLFEYAFLRLLSWFPLWPYIKLMTIFWLITPNFGRASYVYNNLVCPWVTIKPQAVISKLMNWRKLFAKEENFLRHAERYIQENGTEALVKLIDSKVATSKADAEATNAIRASDKKETHITTHNPYAEVANTIRAIDKKGTQQVTTHKADAEATITIGASDNKETQQVTTHNPYAEAANTISATDLKETQQVITHNPYAEAANTISATDLKETQETTTQNPDAEATNSVRATGKKETQQTNGKRIQTEHKDIEDLEVIEKKEISSGKQDIPAMPSHSLSQNNSSATMETNGMAGKDIPDGELPQSSTHKEVQKEWTCALCQMRATCEKDLISHLYGRKHKAACEALNVKSKHVPQKLKNDRSEEKLKQKKIRCEVCDVRCYSEVNMATHLKGRRHLAQTQVYSESGVDGWE